MAECHWTFNCANCNNIYHTGYDHTFLMEDSRTKHPEKPHYILCPKRTQITKPEEMKRMKIEATKTTEGKIVDSWALKLLESPCLSHEGVSSFYVSFPLPESLAIGKIAFVDDCFCISWKNSGWICLDEVPRSTRDETIEKIKIVVAAYNISFPKDPTATTMIIE